jgi:endonuclease/exonuclease/phosphatase family metal-dependent hydrolase
MNRFLQTFAIILALVSFIESKANAFGPKRLKIVWWNIHWGRPAEGDNESLFNQGLQKMISVVNAPDVIVMAEYRPEALQSDTEEDMIRLYPYTQRANYGNETDDTGLILWSKFPFHLDALDSLDFTPPGLSASDQALYRKRFCPNQNCMRPYLQVSLKPSALDGITYTLVAVHINDFWRNFKSEGVLKTFLELAGGTENPVWYQIEAFRNALERNLGSRIKSDKLVVLGDFNVPKSIPFTPLLTRGYQKAGFDLDDAMPNHFTFPTPESTESKSFPKMAIDHAFVSHATEVITSRVRTESGSHHYPLSLEIR